MNAIILLSICSLATSLSKGDQILAQKQDLSIHNTTTAQMGSIYIGSQGALVYKREGKETPLKWIKFSESINSPFLSPNGRWLFGMKDSNNSEYDVGAYDLSIPEEQFLKGNGFLGSFKVDFYSQREEDWKELKTEKQRFVYDNGLIDLLTQEGGKLEGASREDARVHLNRLRASTKDEDKELMKELNELVKETMKLNFRESKHSISRRFCGWLDADTAVFWDSREFLNEANPRPVVMFVNFSAKTISIPSRNISPEINGKIDLDRFKDSFEINTFNISSGVAIDEKFTLKVDASPYPEAARAMVKKSMKELIESQENDKKEKLIGAINEASKRYPKEALPY